MTNLIATDSQKQEIDSPIIDLFELTLPSGSILYFHPGVEDDYSNIQFRDATAPYTQRTYVAFPMLLDGLDISSDGAIARPNFTVANIANNFSGPGGVLGEYKHTDLIGQRITRRQTLKKYLYGESGDASPPVELSKATYIIDRVARETNISVTFEASVVYDLEGINIPRRVSIGKYCSWMYQGHDLYKKGGCTWKLNSETISLDDTGASDSYTIYTHKTYFDIDNKPLVSKTWLETSFEDATCDLTDDPTIIHDSNTNIKFGMAVTGDGIPDTNPTVASVTSATAFELSTATTGGAANNVTLTFKNAPAWNTAFNYTKSSYVTHNSKYWLSKFDHTGQEPSATSSYWTEVREYTEWAASTSYAVGKLVRKVVGAAPSIIDASSSLVVDITDNEITLSDHGYFSGEPIFYSDGGGTAITGLTDNSVYYVIRVDKDTFKLSKTRAGSTLINAADTAQVVVGDNTIVIRNHGYTTNDPVVYSAGGGTVIGGLTERLYYIIKIDDDTIKLSTSSGGSAESLSGVGVGSNHSLAIDLSGLGVGSSHTIAKPLDTIWYCTTAHTSSTSNAPALSSSYWRREELCGKTLNSCKCRYQGKVLAPLEDASVPTSNRSTNQILPFGSFPGMERF